jgi:hypothetical protein
MSSALSSATDWHQFNDGHWRDSCERSQTVLLPWAIHMEVSQPLARKTTTRPRWLSPSHLLSGSRRQLRVRPPGGPHQCRLSSPTGVSKLPVPPPQRRICPQRPGPHHYRGFTITLRHTTFSRSPLDQWSARPSQETDIHAADGIRSRNTGKRAATDPRLRPHGHWHRPVDRLWTVNMGFSLICYWRQKKICIQITCYQEQNTFESTILGTECTGA